MKTLLKSGLALTLGLVLCAGAQAQSRGGGMRVGPFRISSSAGALMRTAPPRQQILVQQTRQRVIFASPFATGFGTPGLGFDFVHFAATHPNARFRRPVFTGFSNGFIPFFGMPFYPDVYPQVVEQPQQQPQVIVIQQPRSEDEEYDTARPRRRAPVESEPLPPPAPVREMGEFVLVRRDGSQLLAVAFSTDGKQVNYVTREGVRRSVALAELDIDATQRTNEERGTTIRLPVHASQPSALPTAPKQTTSL
jgi:hypothetical protein